MTIEHYETHEPVRLYVELERGLVDIAAADTQETTVEAEGPDADRVVVERNGREISVIGPKQGARFFGLSHGISLRITVPTDSDAMVKTGSADVTTHGRLSDLRVKSGSGDVQIDVLAGPGLLETGSGDIAVEYAEGPMRVKSGSGDLAVRTAASEVSASTGSGDITIGTAHAGTSVKTGSGDLQISHAHGDVAMTSGSGDLTIGTAHRGSLQLKGASSDVHVGIPAGLPVWTDISTVTGDVRSGLGGVGAPEDGQEYVELYCRTVSGDITLVQV
jgi:DUF4097 and DUF4098 domain-containing protein YvlB